MEFSVVQDHIAESKLAAQESPFDVPSLLIYEGRSEDAFT
jgi:hypothetical protein